MKKYLFHVGIDISKSKLDVVILDNQASKICNHFIIENNLKGIASILKEFKRQKVDLSTVLFCCENTGVYTFPLSCFLSENKLDYWIVPAIEIKRSKGISRGKNDKTDAKDIAWYSIRHIDKLKLTELPEKEILQLKLLFTEREKVMKSFKLFEATKENEDFMPKQIYKSIVGINSKTIKFLKATLKTIEKEMMDIISNQIQLKNQFELVKSVPGIGDKTAIYLLIITKGFTAFDNARKFACYAGTAPFEHTSGSSIKGRTKVNHMADKKMKAILQMCALVAVKHDPQLKQYYNKKKEEGKNAMLVLNNVKCKILSRVFAVINRQTPYINTYKFAC
ncbi:transposase [Flavobacterium sp. TP390]|uniref:Transposase n=1 Tax=Flavobacterium profundi TaxID=1774945 RepID=A0A6I4IW73_9FLAO|nr:transposase [Flavobacterium profundi]MVO11136.1 transposase [Flavobacterium profundi]